MDLLSLKSFFNVEHLSGEKLVNLVSINWENLISQEILCFKKRTNPVMNDIHTISVRIFIIFN